MVTRHARQYARATEPEGGRPMDPALQELLDKQALWELVHRYCRAVDRADEEMLRSVYHPDALDEHGAYNGGVDGFIDYVKNTSHTLDPEVRKNPTRHVLHNVVFEVDGDTAWGESYVTVRARRRQQVLGRGRRPLHRPLRAAQRRVAHRPPQGRPRVRRRLRHERRSRRAIAIAAIRSTTAIRRRAPRERAEAPSPPSDSNR